MKAAAVIQRTLRYYSPRRSFMYGQLTTGDSPASQCTFSRLSWTCMKCICGLVIWGPKPARDMLCWLLMWRLMFPEGRGSRPVLAECIRFVKMWCCELGQPWACVQPYDWLIDLVQVKESWALNNDDEPLLDFSLYASFRAYSCWWLKVPKLVPFVKPCIFSLFWVKLGTGWNSYLSLRQEIIKMFWEN